LREVEHRREENHQGEKTEGSPGSCHAKRTAAGVFCDRKSDRYARGNQCSRETREQGRSEQQRRKTLAEEEAHVADCRARGEQRENPRPGTRAIRDLAPEGLREQSDQRQHGVDDPDLRGV
jgi:hypothetical protein